MDGRSIGLNLGCGFGDLSKAGENALILENRINILEQVKFDYSFGDYMKHRKFSDAESRLDLIFKPFKERLAQTIWGSLSLMIYFHKSLVIFTVEWSLAYEGDLLVNCLS